MPYRFLEEIAIADVAFEAEGRTLPEVFEASALALTEVMVDLDGVSPVLARQISLTAEDLETLLFRWLAELIYVKDSACLLFNRFEITIREGTEWELKATVRGDQINYEKMPLKLDVKAVTYHLFALEETPHGWRAQVVLDI
ncbi:MAG: archease [Candidatus Methylomirabilales bacterium]